VVANLSNVYPKDTKAPPPGVDDMTKLSYLHEPGVLQNLATRYELHEIYVSDLLMIVYFLQFTSTNLKSHFFVLVYEFKKLLL
jgi:hypothetical protein